MTNCWFYLPPESESAGMQLLAWLWSWYHVYIHVLVLGTFCKSVVNNVNLVMIFESSGMQLLAWLWSWDDVYICLFSIFFVNHLLIIWTWLWFFFSFSYIIIIDFLKGSLFDLDFNFTLGKMFHFFLWWIIMDWLVKMLTHE